MDVDYMMMKNYEYRKKLPSLVEEEDRQEEPNIKVRRFFLYVRCNETTIYHL